MEMLPCHPWQAAINNRKVLSQPNIIYRAINQGPLRVRYLNILLLLVGMLLRRFTLGYKRQQNPRVIGLFLSQLRLPTIDHHPKMRRVRMDGLMKLI